MTASRLGLYTDQVQYFGHWWGWGGGGGCWTNRSDPWRPHLTTCKTCKNLLLTSWCQIPEYTIRSPVDSINSIIRRFILSSVSFTPLISFLSFISLLQRKVQTQTALRQWQIVCWSSPSLPRPSRSGILPMKSKNGFAAFPMWTPSWSGQRTMSAGQNNYCWMPRGQGSQNRV